MDLAAAAADLAGTAPGAADRASTTTIPRRGAADSLVGTRTEGEVDRRSRCRRSAEHLQVREAQGRTATTTIPLHVAAVAETVVFLPEPAAVPLRVRLRAGSRPALLAAAAVAGLGCRTRPRDRKAPAAAVVRLARVQLVVAVRVGA